MSDKIFIICKICNCEFISNKSLGVHIKRTHHIELKDYYDNFLKSLMKVFVKYVTNQQNIGI